MSYGRGFVGSKYDAKRDVKDTAALIRAEIKALVAAGELPNGKYGVTIERYSGGRSINITVGKLAGVLINNPAPHRPPEPRERYSVKFREVRKRLEAIHASYNFDDSDSMTDYFHVGFYGGVLVDWKVERDELAEIEALAKRGIVVKEKPAVEAAPEAAHA